MAAQKKLTRQDVESDYAGKYRLNKDNYRLANEMMELLWNERNKERGITTKDRSGSCKFAALMARELFGGRLAGNQHHVFVLRKGSVFDLNADQEDVSRLGDKAYQRDSSITHHEYRESMASCLPRVSRWCLEFERRHTLEKKCNKLPRALKEFLQ